LAVGASQREDHRLHLLMGSDPYEDIRGIPGVSATA
jgi:hypothetical protein